MSTFCRATSVASWTRRIAVAVAATVAVTAVGVAPARAITEDNEGPIILNASVSHQKIDVVDGPVQATVRLEVQDLGSGLATGFPWLDPQPDYGSDPISGQAMALVSGDRFHGIYESTFTFPEFIRGGDWYFVPRILDVAGNNLPHSGIDSYDSIGVVPTVVSLGDNDAPTVAASLTSPSIVDVTDGPAKVVVNVEARDSGIGVPSNATAQIMATHDNAGYGWRPKNSSTDSHRAIFKATFDYPKYDDVNSVLGSYTFSVGSVTDSNGNMSRGLSAGRVIVATRPLRAKLPTLTASIGSVKATWAEHTDLLGIQEYETEFTGAGIVRKVRTGATEASIGDLPDGTYAARVRARNQLGWGEWTNASAPVAYIPAPLTGSTPTVLGTVKVGQTLTANPGAWTTGTTFAYQWLAGGLAVSGATGSTLVLGPGQAGKAIAVRVTGSKTGYVTSSKISAATAVVARGSLAGVPPTITGTARVGSTLTANPGLWSPAPVTLSYQWYRSGVVITGATLSTYKLTTSDLGKTVTVRAAASKSGYNYTYKTSAATVPVATNVLTAPKPVIPAAAAVGQTLTVKVGAWTPTVYLRTYQWKRDGISIPGATASSYKVVAADLGAGLSIAVTGRKSGYLTKTVTSNSTGPVTK